MNAAENHLTFVSFEDISFKGKLLEQSCAITFTVSERIFPVNEGSKKQNNDQGKINGKSFRVDIDLSNKNYKMSYSEYVNLIYDHISPYFFTTDYKDKHRLK